MARLTKRSEDGQAIIDCASCELHGCGCSVYNCRNRLIDRLVKYEDLEEKWRMSHRKLTPIELAFLEQSNLEL